MDAIRRIADAVLYEGYVLWPYRRSALKNQRRWTFGGVYPPDWSARHPDDPSEMRTECLLEGGDPEAVEVRVRFLHVVRRQAARRRADGGLEEVDALAGALSWDEAAEREVGPGPFAIAAGRDEEVRDDGVLVRTWEGLRGSVHVASEAAAPGVSRIAARVANATPLRGGDREDALRHAFVSTHTVLHSPDGAFVSLTDPPARLRDAAAACANAGTWPVLAGEPGERDTLLSSPIILEDHPRVAPESPGDLFDSAEIDQLLVLSILSMTEAEQAEMRASDPRVREILERTAALTAEERMRLHGTIRELRRLPG